MYRLEDGGMPKKKTEIVSGSRNRISGSQLVRIHSITATATAGAIGESIPSIAAVAGLPNGGAAV